MKRSLLLALLLPLLLISCENSDEKEAVECLKTHLGIPTSFNIISVDVTKVNDTIIYDTLYHVSTVDSARGIVCGVDDYVDVYLFSYDSIEVFESSFYPTTVYHIKYELETADGIKQDEATVYFADSSYSTDFKTVIKYEKQFFTKKALAGTIDMSPDSINCMGIDSWFQILHFKGEPFSRSEYLYFNASPNYVIYNGVYAPSLAVNGDEDDNIHTIVEELPEFPGGKEVFEEYISKNMQYPERAKKMGIQGRVICQFIVRKDGSIEDVVVRRGSDPALYIEAIRLLSEMPKWKPGKMKGKSVNCYHCELIEFKLPK